MSNPRVVSLIASATEIVAALGCEAQLVGRSHECDFPASVLDLPACSAPKFDVHGDSRQIDERVKSVLALETSVYSVHADLLDRLQPDLVITQAQCEVCAVSLKDVARAALNLESCSPRVLALSPNALADVWDDIQRTADALDRSAHGRSLVLALKSRLDSLSQRVQALNPVKPRVACIEWIEPLMAAGNWVPELVELAGGVNLFGKAGAHSPWMSWSDLVAADPDVIAVMPCGYDMPKASTEMHWLTDRPEWTSLAAVRNGRVYVTDGNQYFNRPGPRLVESAEILAELLHPDHFNFGHAPNAWIRWPGVASPIAAT